MKLRAFLSNGRFWPPLVALIVVVILAAATADMLLRDGAPEEKLLPPSPVPVEKPSSDVTPETPTEPSKEESLADAQFVIPENWPKDHPVPLVKSNCVRCHIGAGLVLTAAVRDFAHSTHDLQQMTCYDCHGGNPDDDVSAHEEQHGFIGGKLSAHLKKCAECHAEQAEILAAGPHHWDWSERINTNYPMCIDCHGNHDVGNPPADFKVADTCLDCHHDLEKEQPALAGVIEHLDELWGPLAEVRKRQIGQETDVPPEFAAEVDALRAETMRIVHGLGPLTPEQAAAHNEKSAELKKKLDAWLEKNR